jgi:hypothetical protein
MQVKSDLSSDRTASVRGYRSTDEIRSNSIWTRSTPATPTDELRSNSAIREPQQKQTAESAAPQSNGAAHATGNSGQNTTAATAQTDTHYHTGSANESLVPFTTQIRRGLKAEIQRQASGANVSDSAAGAALLEKAIQGTLLKENAAELRPIIQGQIHKDIQRFSNRTANLALEAFYSAEEGRMLTIYLLRFILGDDALLEKIVADVRSEARESLKRYSYAYAQASEAEEAYARKPRQEVPN